MHAIPRDGLQESPKCPACHDASTVSAFVETLAAFMNMRNLELADLDIADYDARRSGLWTRGLPIRRNIAGGDLAFFSTWSSAGTPIETLVKVEGQRWAIEDSFETAKNELGLDHNETRSWRGWHRHVSLVMLAFAMMAVIRHRTNADSPPKMNPRKVLRQRRHAR